MDRKSFLRNLIAVPFIGSAILDLATSKESSPVEVSKFSIPIMSHDDMQAIKNPFNGQMVFTNGDKPCVWTYYNDYGWYILSTRFMVNKEVSEDLKGYLSNRRA